MALVSPTSIESNTYAALTELGVSFQPQRRVGPYLVDAFISETSTIIECQGDYYHCNPAVFTSGPINDMQRRAFERDAKRRAYFASHGYRLIELWEHDIHSRGALALLEDQLAAPVLS
jgi:very-short-patch-repair endonuclease